MKLTELFLPIQRNVYQRYSSPLKWNKELNQTRTRNNKRTATGPEPKQNRIRTKSEPSLKHNQNRTKSLSNPTRFRHLLVEGSVGASYLPRPCIIRSVDNIIHDIREGHHASRAVGVEVPRRHRLQRRPTNPTTMFRVGTRDQRISYTDPRCDQLITTAISNDELDL